MEMNMGNQKVGQGIPVCKNCGAMGRPGNLHCVFCGAVLEPGTQLPRHTTGQSPKARVPRTVYCARPRRRGRPVQPRPTARKYRSQR